MSPVSANETDSASRGESDSSVGKVPPVIRGEADEGNHASGLHQFRQSRESLLGVEVMQGRDGNDRIEGPVLEGDGHDIAVSPLDAMFVVPRPGALEHARIQIEADDVAHPALSDLGRQNPITTPNVEHALRVGGNSVEEQRVIVDVGVPQPVAAHANLYTRATISWYVLPAIRGRDVTRG